MPGVHDAALTPTFHGCHQMGAFDGLLTQMSLAVRTQLNTAASIHRLPSETLAEIFGLACWVPLDLSFPVAFSRTFRSTRILERKIMTVCRMWRDIALSAGFLWSDIALVSGGTSDSHAQCSRTGSLLNVYYDSSLFGHDSCLSLLNEHGKRVRALYLRDVEENVRRYFTVIDISPSLQLIAPCVEELVLFLHPPAQFSPVLEEPLFSGCAPKLRLLGLFGTHFVPTDHFPSLRELHIRTEYKFSQLKIIKLLQNTPQLQEAYIAPSVLQGTLSDDDVAVVSKLRRLALFLNIDPSPLLRSIVFPACCLVRLRRIVLDHVPGCFAAIEGSLDGSQLTRLSLQYKRSQAWWPEFLLLTLCDTSAQSGVIIDIPHRSTMRDRTRTILCDIFSTSLLYANVRELTIFDYRKMTNAEFLNSLPSLDTINHVFHSGSLNKRRGRPVRVPILASTSAQGELIACPGLKTLYFILCGPQHLEDARTILEVRRRAQRPIRRLGLVCSEEYKEQARALGLLVDELDVSHDIHRYQRGTYDPLAAEWQDQGAAKAVYHWPEGWPDREY
ncbi:hypothetical protein C8Q77DRAFT_1139873 [Trametes polyzona]|nr:hypothetical protein C8Q77DRAFT_1139873 [Trametes polyzona]